MGFDAAGRLKEMGTEKTPLVGSGNWEIFGNLWNFSFNPVWGGVEFKLQGNEEWVDEEEVVGVHIDDSLERFGCEG